MPRKTEMSTNKAVTLGNYVTVAFAEDIDLAREYIDLLERNEITAAIKRQPQMAESGFSDIAIQVPEESLDEAHKLISQQAAYDDFFDMAFNQDHYQEHDASSGNIEEADDDFLY